MNGAFTVDRDVDGATLTVPVTPTAGIERFIQQVKTHDGLRATLLFLITRPDGDVHQVQAEKNLRRLATEALTERLTEAEADQLVTELATAGAVDYCAVSGCGNYRVDAEHCGNHLRDDYRPVTGVWSVA